MKKQTSLITAVLATTLLLAGCQPHYRYPCQDPDNWDKPICQKPMCDVNRECPEHIFKGQRDPRLGPPPDSANNNAAPAAPMPGPRPPAPKGECK